MSVGRICQREVDLASVDENVSRAAERMHQRTVGSLVVLNDEREPVGIVTDRDLTIRVLAPGRDPFTTTVGDVMTKFPETVREDTPIEHALTLMRRGSFRRLPVVDHNGQLAGLVTLDDIMMLLSEELGSVGRLLESETPQSAATR